jgi:hypothetical protein
MVIGLYAPVLRDGNYATALACQTSSKLERHVWTKFSLRVNRRSIVWLTARRQGHYEKTDQTIYSSVFRSSFDYASLRQETAIKTSRGSVTLLFLSELVQICGAKTRRNCARSEQKFSETPYS